MPEVCFAVSAQQLDSVHSQTGVRALKDVCFFKLRMETGPTTAGVEFAVRVKKGMAAANAMILPTLPAGFIFATEWRLRSGLPGHAVLFRRQLLAPFLVGLAYFRHVGILTKLWMACHKQEQAEQSGGRCQSS